MKKKQYLQILTFILVIMNGCIYSQQDTVNNKSRIVKNYIKKNDIHLIVKVDVLSPVLLIIEKQFYSLVTIEGCIKQRHSLQFSALHTRTSTSIDAIDKYVVSMQLIQEYKFYITKKKTYTGFYLGPYIRLSSNTSTFESKVDVLPYSYLEYQEGVLGGGVVGGYQNYIKKRIVVDILIGCGVRQIFDTRVVESINADLGNQKKTFLDTRLSLNIGYKF